MPAYDSRTIYPSVARTATVTGDDQTNLGHKGLILTVNLTALAAAETVTPKIQGKDANGVYYDILTGAAIVTTTTAAVVMKLYPGLTAATNLAANDILPAVWRVVLTHSSTGSHTYSVAACLVP